MKDRYEELIERVEKLHVFPNDFVSIRKSVVNELVNAIKELKEKK